jgi:hypothetical protein
VWATPDATPTTALINITPNPRGFRRWPVREDASVLSDPVATATLFMPITQFLQSLLVAGPLP